MRGGIRLVAVVALLAACDAVAEEATDGGFGSTSAAAGSTGPAYTSPCWTVGDWCTIALGDAQCGERMACLPVEGSGSASGVCVAPCSAAAPCAIGKCNLKIGACVDDGVFVPPVVCD